mmetsp:Transcript_25384/g.64474  ORF Transcript_25384/g.64474 Transcript_25384/m.64474 type:complete len:262 (-) Transcript_25384:2073-2858(-)
MSWKGCMNMKSACAMVGRNMRRGTPPTPLPCSSTGTPPRMAALVAALPEMGTSVAAPVKVLATAPLLASWSWSMVGPLRSCALSMHTLTAAPLLAAGGGCCSSLEGDGWGSISHVLLPVPPASTLLAPAAAVTGVLGLASGAAAPLPAIPLMLAAGGCDPLPLASGTPPPLVLRLLLLCSAAMLCTASVVKPDAAAAAVAACSTPVASDPSRCATAYSVLATLPALCRSPATSPWLCGCCCCDACCCWREDSASARVVKWV